MKLLDTSSCVVVTGSSGSGKSTIVHNVALRLQDQGYNIQMVDEPSQIFQNNIKKNVYVLDDPFGKCTIYRDKLYQWEAHLDKLKTVLQIKRGNEASTKSEQISVGKTIILISCRLIIYKNHFVSRISKALKFQECDLSSVDICLTLSEKQEMFAKYIENMTFDSVKCDMDYFPLVCMLSRHKEPEIVKTIFKDAPQHIREEIENMKHDDTLELQFCCLCLCVMFDQGFNLNWLRMWDVEDDNNPGAYQRDDRKKVISIMFKEFQCDVNSERIRCKLLDSFCTLNGSYCREVGDIVVFRHDKILDVAAKICGETLLSTYISHASSKFIAKRFTLHDSPQVVTNEYLIQIPPYHENKYFSRIFEDLVNTQTDSFAYNDQLENENFQNKLMQYVELHNKQAIIQSTIHKYPQTMEHSLADIKGGFKIYSEFLFKLGVNKDNVLVWVCQEGNTTALEYLLTSCSVNVNKQRKCSHVTPLLAAVLYGDVHNVSLLLQFKADVNLGDKWGMTPLMYAADRDNKECLEFLLQNNASVSQCDKLLEYTALHHAVCGDIECVKLLLQYNSDVMQKCEFGNTSLDIAKLKGYTDIVHILQKHAI